jgi:hypothetical protein
LTEGRDFPTDTGVPRRLTFAPPRETVPPGAADPVSKGICGFTDAQPNNSNPTKDANKTLFFLEIISHTPLNIWNPLAC